MNFKQCMDFIGSYSRLGAKVTDLSRANELMERIGNPQNDLKFVHIAGTNGKGSTLEYISKALELSGYKTGKFTSPFVTHYTDRIRINDREIDENSLSEICGFVAAWPQRLQPVCFLSFFFGRDSPRISGEILL